MTVTKWSCYLQPPMSLNNAYANVQGRGRVLTPRGRAWKDEAANRMMASGVRSRIKGPVRVFMAFNPVMAPARIDTDNCAKLPLDALVAMGVIENDTRLIVRQLVLTWDEENWPSEGMFISVEALQQ